MEIFYLYITAYRKNKSLTNHLIFSKLEEHTLKKYKGSSILYNLAGKIVYIIHFLYVYIKVFIRVYMERVLWLNLTIYITVRTLDTLHLWFSLSSYDEISNLFNGEQNWLASPEPKHLLPGAPFLLLLCPKGASTFLTTCVTLSS